MMKMSLKSKRITHRILDNEHFPVIRPSAYGRIARLDHAIRLLEEDGDGVGISGSLLVIVRAVGVTPGVLGRLIVLLVAGRRLVVAGIAVAVGVMIAALIAAFWHSELVSRGRRVEIEVYSCDACVQRFEQRGTVMIKECPSLR